MHVPNRLLILGFPLHICLGCTPQAVNPKTSVAGAAEPALPVAPCALDLRHAGPPLGVERDDAQSEGQPGDPLMLALEHELDRAVARYGQESLAPHYVAYNAVDSVEQVLVARDGFTVTQDLGKNRSLEVDIRLGEPEFDSTHNVSEEYYLGATPLPVDDDTLALRAPIWLATESAYHAATETYYQARADASVAAPDSDTSGDFAKAPVVHHVERLIPPRLHGTDWPLRVETMSRRLRDTAGFEGNEITLTSSVATRYFVTSEGTRLRTSQPSASLRVRAWSRASDGALLERVEEAFASDVENLPAASTIDAIASSIALDLQQLLAAPVGEPYVGPALLDGLAAAVLFHEVLGHRVEGHRLKNNWEGKTFQNMVGTRVMPSGFSVFDDPTLRSANGVELSGFYTFDDEGVPGERVSLIDDGVFRGFLMSRLPAEGFPRSNGHGRKQSGFRAVARQSNLVIYPSKPTTKQALRMAFLDELKRQGKPYGLRISRVSGGDTQTSVFDPQAFQVHTVLVYKVYLDGREQLIRGVKLEGTPLELLSSVMAAGNDFSVFNGFCGAESGQVPVSATSPSLLLKRIEVARAPVSDESPPLIEPPPRSEGAEP